MKLSRNLLAMVLLSFTVLGANAHTDWQVVMKYPPLSNLLPPAWQPLIEGEDFVFMLPDSEPLMPAFDITERGDFRKAVKLFPTLAEQGNVGAQFLLAVMFDEGLGVKQDSQQAKKWYKKTSELLLSLAEKGDMTAQFLLATIFDEGKGGMQDFQQAVKWYQKAAEKGLADAQYQLAMMYHHGKGVTQDYQKAVEWLNKSAAQYNDFALIVLGGYYLEGIGVPKDRQKAKAYFTQACDEAGLDMGCYMQMELEEK
ncbi:tetratricopeptide repeat protein [Avibacterium paragallinarum]|uniref:tetratricopeptide repeat protein n=1 Tax=Avibacterium paragallinarum TaxID=728 RepID=UPI00397E50F5